MTFGSGDYTYRAVEGWGDWDFGIVTSMATDSKDNVYVIDREPNPAIVVMDRNGKVLNTWGQDFFKVPHSIWISPDDKAYITDCELHIVTVHSLDGELISMLGTPNKPGGEGKPFNSPTWVVLGNNNDMYVSDGYGHNYVHRFTADGGLMCTWGGTGSEPGKFDTPHCVKVDKNDRVFILDRTNSRIQIFDDQDQLLEVLGKPGAGPGEFNNPWSIALDSEGNLYVADSRNHRVQKFLRRRPLRSGSGANQNSTHPVKTAS